MKGSEKQVDLANKVIGGWNFPAVVQKANDRGERYAALTEKLQNAMDIFMANLDEVNAGSIIDFRHLNGTEALKALAAKFEQYPDKPAYAIFKAFSY